jgi:hypothetical protein
MDNLNVTPRRSRRDLELVVVTMKEGHAPAVGVRGDDKGEE